MRACQRLVLALMGLFAVLAVLVPAATEAAEIVVTPRASVRETYDTSLYLQDVSDFETRLTPGLTLGANTDTSRVSLDASADIFRYMEHSSFERENQHYKLSALHSLSPMWSVGVDAGYEVDHNVDTALEETGLLVKQSERTTPSVTPSVRWVIDEVNALELRPSYSQTDDTNGDNADYQVLGSDLIWSRALNQGKTMLYAVGGMQQIHFKFPTGTGDQRITQALVGLSHKFTETFNATLRAGPTFTDSSYSLSGLDSSKNDMGYAFDGSLNWYWERYSLTVGVEHGQTQSVLGENITRDKGKVQFNYAFTERLKAGVGGSYLTSESDGLISRTKSAQFTLSPNIVYDLTKDMSIRFGWDYQEYRNEISHSNLSGNRIYGAFSVSFPQIY